MSKNEFNFEEALKAIQSGQAITGKDGVLATLVKKLTEAALSSELDHYIEANPHQVADVMVTVRRPFKRHLEALNWRHRETVRVNLSPSL